MSDFTISKNPERRERYIERHNKKIKTGLSQVLIQPVFGVKICFGMSQQYKKVIIISRKVFIKMTSYINIYKDKLNY